MMQQWTTLTVDRSLIYICLFTWQAEKINSLFSKQLNKQLAMGNSTHSLHQTSQKAPSYSLLTLFHQIIFPIFVFEK